MLQMDSSSISGVAPTIPKGGGSESSSVAEFSKGVCLTAELSCSVGIWEDSASDTEEESPSRTATCSSAAAVAEGL